MKELPQPLIIKYLNNEIQFKIIPLQIGTDVCDISYITTPYCKISGICLEKKVDNYTSSLLKDVIPMN